MHRHFLLRGPSCRFQGTEIRNKPSEQAERTMEGGRRELKRAAQGFHNFYRNVVGRQLQRLTSMRQISNPNPCRGSFLQRSGPLRAELELEGSRQRSPRALVLKRDAGSPPIPCRVCRTCRYQEHSPHSHRFLVVPPSCDHGGCHYIIALPCSRETSRVTPIVPQKRNESHYVHLPWHAHRHPISTLHDNRALIARVECHPSPHASPSTYHRERGSNN